MPDTDSSTSSDAPDRKGAARGGKPGGAPADPTDRVREALDQAAAVVTGARPEQVATAIKGDLESFLKRLIPPPPAPVPDICGTPTPKVRGFCNTKTLSYQQAKITYDGSKEAAMTALRSSLSAWSLAVSEYEYGMADADTTLRATVTDATTAYNQKQNEDSTSRSFYLWFTLKQATAAAIVAYEGSATSAAATLSGAAGDLLAAYQGYIDAINAAQSQRLDDEATADQTLWQSVEGVLDAV